MEFPKRNMILYCFFIPKQKVVSLFHGHCPPASFLYVRRVFVLRWCVVVKDVRRMSPKNANLLKSNVVKRVKQRQIPCFKTSVNTYEKSWFSLYSSIKMISRKLKGHILNLRNLGNLTNSIHNPHLSHFKYNNAFLPFVHTSFKIIVGLTVFENHLLKLSHFSSFWHQKTLFLWIQRRTFSN